MRKVLAEVFVAGFELLRPVRNGALHELPCAVADEAARLIPRDGREGEGGKRLVDVILDVAQRIQKGAVQIQHDDSVVHMYSFFVSSAVRRLTRFLHLLQFRKLNQCTFLELSEQYKQEQQT